MVVSPENILLITSAVLDRWGGKYPECCLCNSISWNWGDVILTVNELVFVSFRCRRCMNTHFICISKLDLPGLIMDIDKGDATTV